MDFIKKLKIDRVEDGKIEAIEDSVIAEYPLTIFLNGEEFVTLLCSPKGLEYLAIGFLVSEGIIKDKGQIKNISIDEKEGHVHVDLQDESLFTKKLFGKRTVTTGCGKCTVFYNVLDSLGTRPIDSKLQIRWDKALGLANELNEHSAIFKETGGVHNYALADQDRILLFQEDIGRHNALDKIIGQSILSKLDLGDKILISSGRVSSEMAIKTIKSRIPILVSRSAPTELAINMAKEFNLTLIGFARGNRMNIYSGGERILTD